MRILRNPKIRRRYWQIQDKRLQRQESYVLYHLRRFFRDQQRRILERLPKEQKGLEDVVFNKEEEVQLMSKAFLPVLEKVLREEGDEAADRFNIDFNYTATAETFIQRRSNQMASDITDTTFDQIKNDIQTSLAEGENYTAMADRLTERYDQINTGRANTIARTEAGISQSAAQFEAYKQGGVESKTWVARLDGKTRPSHVAMDGERVALSQPFSNGLMRPRDPSGPAEEVINCRCNY